MESFQDNLAKIIELLKDHPRGLTVLDISHGINVNRNSVAKYLAVLLTSGKVEKQAVGPAKVFFLSQRAPIFSMFNHSSDCIIVLDGELKIIQVNDKLLDLTGQEREVVVGGTLTDSPLSFMQTPDVLEHIQEALEAKESIFELSHSHSGVIHRLKVKTIPTNFEDGTKGVTVMLENITERIKAQRALRDSEERYRSLFESARDMIHIVDSNGLIVDANRFELESLGYTKGEYIGKPLMDIIHPDFIEPSREAFSKVMNGNEMIGYETALITRSGRKLFVEVNAVPEVLEGKVVSARAIIRDIGERKQAAHALEEREARYRELFETMVLGVVYQDVSGKITSANPAAERILGLTLDQMQGRTSVDLRWRAIHEDGTDFPGETHPSMVAVRTGEEVRNVIMGIFDPRKEAYTWININAVPQFKPGNQKPYQVYTTFEDITYRYKALKGVTEPT